MRNPNDIRIIGKESFNRFELEEGLLSMYRITDDILLALDEEERKAVVKMHLVRCDKLFDMFESMVMEGKIV